MGRESVAALLAGLLALSGCSRVDGPVPPEPPRAKILPESASYWIARGATRVHEVLVDLSAPPPSNEPLFVAIVMDATGSMRPFVGAAQHAAITLVEAVHGRSVAAHIAVAAFEDFSKATLRLQWQVHQPFTRDKRSAAAAIGEIRTGSAGALNVDGPEPYSCALVRAAQHLNWGVGRRYLVFVGDATPVSPDVCDTREGLRGVYPEDGYRELSAGNIQVISLYARGESPESAAFFNEVARRTGGVAFPLQAADALPSAILSGLDAKMTLGPRIVVPDAIRDRVVAVSGPQRLSPTLFRFKVELTSPTCAPSGRVPIALPVVYTDAAATPLGVARVVISASVWRYWPVQLTLLLLIAALLVWLLFRRFSASRQRRLYYLSTAPAVSAIRFFATVGAAATIAVLVIYAAPALPEHDILTPLDRLWWFGRDVVSGRSGTC